MTPVHVVAPIWAFQRQGPHAVVVLVLDVEVVVVVLHSPLPCVQEYDGHTTNVPYVDEPHGVLGAGQSPPTTEPHGTMLLHELTHCAPPCLLHS